eukprot:4802132-Pyramimonas_sp.AAC.1
MRLRSSACARLRVQSHPCPRQVLRWVATTSIGHIPDALIKRVEPYALTMAVVLHRLQYTFRKGAKNIAATLRRRRGRMWF